MYLVDAGTGLLRGTRTLALSPAVWATLEAALGAERAKPFRGDYAYGKEVARARDEYPTPKAILRQALASCRCEG